MERYLSWIKNNLSASGFSSVHMEVNGLHTEDVSPDRVVLSVDRGVFRSYVRYEVYGPTAEENRRKLLAWHYEFVGGVVARGWWWRFLLHLGKWLLMVSVPVAAGLLLWWITAR
ncbi:hypothetical protein [Sphaerisporangium sp. TRM90804]|uniref:hypothetical protein n=1 Tax=Sphaerisporangium sp. TRM90804 TaxID=3031113 RepID=UPI00244D6314|nr:hypothetical protein [Sphaerisporangium sp. TRM90804]MDH2426753.1 hypothetical protein [Sphaerisporangium sp. TRM90804]